MKHSRNKTIATALALLSAGTALAQADDAPWPVAGQQGVMRFVIVPEAQARDPEAYRRQIDRLCEPGRTCFLNFYTNSSDAPITVPLPDAIDREAAAVYRRSAKQVAARLQWSCRLQLPGADDCF